MDSATINAIGGVAVLIIGAIAAGIVLVISALNKNKEVVQVANQKMDRVELLINGRYGEVLQELADVRRQLAELSNRATDKQAAEAAQIKADEQKERLKHLEELKIPSLKTE